MGIYAERHEFLRVVLFFSQDLDERLMGRLTASLRSRNIQILQQTPVESIEFRKDDRTLSPISKKRRRNHWIRRGQSTGCRQIHRISLPASLSLGADVALERWFLQFAVQSHLRRQAPHAAVGHAIRRDSRHCRVLECSGSSLAFRCRRSRFETHSGDRLENGLSRDWNSGR